MPRALSVDHVQLAMPRGEEQSARDFYVGVLGLMELPKQADRVARGGVWFRCGELQVHLGVEDPFRPAKKAHPAFVVDDLASFVSFLKRSRSPGANAGRQNCGRSTHLYRRPVWKPNRAHSNW